MDYRKLLLSFIIVFAAAAVGSIFTSSAISGWYSQIAKPEFNPPNWVFGPVWTALYVLIAISLYIIWDKKKEKSAKSKTEKGNAYIFFFIQLALNALWSIVFFGLQSPLLGLVTIIPLLLFIMLTIREFWKISRNASWLLVPYIIWCLFATFLNYSIFVLN